jgi:putative ABC transport system ATP-binding protein
LLVCDRPTDDLNRQCAEEVLAMLQHLTHEHGKTIVTVTHDAKAAEYASHMLHLDRETLAGRSVFA